MRIRSIKPEFWSSLTLAQLTREQRLFFIGLWQVADDEGRGKADARLLKGTLFPMDDDLSAAVLEGWMGQLEALGLIQLYQDERCRPLYQVRTFREHQRPDKPKPSRLSPPPRAVGDASGTNPGGVGVGAGGAGHGARDPGHGAGGSEQGESAGRRTAGYLTRCCLALHRGLAANLALGGFNELAPASQEGVVAWEEDGVPIELAERIIEERARAYVPRKHNRQPKSLRYFDAAVREAWEGLPHWVDAVRELLRPIGLFKPAEVYGALAEGVAVYGEEDVLRATRSYVKHAPDREQPQYLGPAGLARQLGYYVEFSRPGSGAGMYERAS